jgi:hypothetical protein
MVKCLVAIYCGVWLFCRYRHWAQYDRKDYTPNMKTAIGYPTYYTVIYRKRLAEGLGNGYFRRHIGNYSDIRDAIQAIVTAHRRARDDNGEFLIGTTSVKPNNWLHPTSYIEEK